LLKVPTSLIANEQLLSASFFYSDFLVSLPKSPSSYDYYVHFEGLDKRNDNWVTSDKIEATTLLLLPEEDNGQESETVHPNQNVHFGMDKLQIQMHEEITKFKTVPRISIGSFVADAWYYSPYPPQYHHLDILYLCEFCLNFYAKEEELLRHDRGCPLTHPPGDEIYRDE
jgi:hypothetical protein